MDGSMFLVLFAVSVPLLLIADELSTINKSLTKMLYEEDETEEDDKTEEGAGNEQEDI